MTNYQLNIFLKNLAAAVSPKEPATREYKIIHEEDLGNGHRVYQTDAPGNPLFFE